MHINKYTALMWNTTQKSILSVISRKYTHPPFWREFVVQGGHLPKICPTLRISSTLNPSLMFECSYISIKHLLSFSETTATNGQACEQAVQRQREGELDGMDEVRPSHNKNGQSKTADTTRCHQLGVEGMGIHQSGDHHPELQCSQKMTV